MSPDTKINFIYPKGLDIESSSMVINSARAFEHRSGILASSLQEVQAITNFQFERILAKVNHQRGVALSTLRRSLSRTGEGVLDWSNLIAQPGNTDSEEDVFYFDDNSPPTIFDQRRVDVRKNEQSAGGYIIRIDSGNDNDSAEKETAIAFNKERGFIAQGVELKLQGQAGRLTVDFEQILESLSQVRGLPQLEFTPEEAVNYFLALPDDEVWLRPDFMRHSDFRTSLVISTLGSLNLEVSLGAEWRFKQIFKDAPTHKKLRNKEAAPRVLIGVEDNWLGQGSKLNLPSLQTETGEEEGSVIIKVVGPTDSSGRPGAIYGHPTTRQATVIGDQLTRLFRQ